MQQLLAEECAQPGTFLEDINTIKQKLEFIDQHRYRVAIIRARAENLCAVEMPTKRALGAEKKYASKNEIREIEYKGAVHIGKEAIAGVFSEYYRELFSRTSVDANRFKEEFVSLMPRLEDDIKEILQMPITEEESDREFK